MRKDRKNCYLSKFKGATYSLAAGTVLFPASVFGATSDELASRIDTSIKSLQGPAFRIAVSLAIVAFIIIGVALVIATDERTSMEVKKRAKGVAIGLAIVAFAIPIATFLQSLFA